MKIVDLEIYRWEFFRNTYLKFNSTQQRKNNLSAYSMRQYWHEIGAFVSILPRQSGKSQMVAKMASTLSDKKEYSIIITHSTFSIYNYRNSINTQYIAIHDTNFNFSGVQYKDFNLFLDEFMSMRNNYVDTLLDKDWKSVTMVSSLR